MTQPYKPQPYKLPGPAGRIQALFVTEGVTHLVEPVTESDHRWFGVPATCKWCISCGQTHFYFDASGEYVGLHWDEMGTWEPKETAT